MNTEISTSLIEYYVPGYWGCVPCDLEWPSQDSFSTNRANHMHNARLPGFIIFMQYQIQTMVVFVTFVYFMLPLGLSATLINFVRSELNHRLFSLSLSLSLSLSQWSVTCKSYYLALSKTIPVYRWKTSYQNNVVVPPCVSILNSLKENMNLYEVIASIPCFLRAFIPMYHDKSSPL